MSRAATTTRTGRDRRARKPGRRGQSGLNQLNEIGPIDDRFDQSKLRGSLNALIALRYDICTSSACTAARSDARPSRPARRRARSSTSRRAPRSTRMGSRRCEGQPDEGSAAEAPEADVVAADLSRELLERGGREVARRERDEVVLRGQWGTVSSTYLEVVAERLLVRAVSAGRHDPHSVIQPRQDEAQTFAEMAERDLDVRVLQLQWTLGAVPDTPRRRCRSA